MNDLAHYGVPGMHWGIRRKTGLSSSEDHTISRTLKKKPLKSLTNDELKKLNNRLQMEETYKKLNPGSLKRGQSVVAGILSAGTTVTSLYLLTQSPVAQQVKKIINAKRAGKI